MSLMQERVFAGLPAYLDRDPHKVPAVSVQYAGTCSATVDRHVLTLLRAGLAPLSYDLASMTLAALVAAIDATGGFTASLIDVDGAGTGAASLMDVDGQDLGATNRLFRFTSPLWAIVSPIAWALADSRENMDHGLAEASLKTAEGQWVDLWGVEYYGGVRRNAAEADRAYADRIIREVQRWRLNNKALEVIVKEELGVEAHVTNLHEQAWVVSETPFGRLVGRKYSRTTFEVMVEGIVSGLSDLIERSRAAGTLPFYRLQDAAEDESVDGLGNCNKIGTRVNIGSDNIWTVGFDDMGFSLMTGTDRQYNVTIVCRADEYVFHVGGAGDFVLGVSTLGGQDLGSGGASVPGDTIAIGETTVVI